MPRILGRRRTYSQMVYGRKRVAGPRRRSAIRSRRRYRRRGRADGQYKEKVTLVAEIGTAGGAEPANTAFNYVSWFE